MTDLDEYLSRLGGGGWSINAISGLILPTGAGPGTPRVILDGTTAEITLVGTNEDDKIILRADGPLGTPHINIQSSIAPGDTIAGYGYGTSGPEMLGEEYTNSYNGFDNRSRINQSTFFTDVGQFRSTGTRNGGLLSTGDTHSRLIMYDNGTEMGRVEVTLDTLSGGIRLYAEDLPDPEIRMTGTNYQFNGREQAQGNVDSISSNADTAAIGAEAVVLTLPSITWKTGQAYEIINAGRLHKGSVGNAVFRLRRDNLAGALFSTLGAIAVPEINVDYSYVQRLVVRRTAGTDLNEVLCLTLQASAGTVINDGATDIPRYLEVRHIGSEADYAFGPAF